MEMDSLRIIIVEDENLLCELLQNALTRIAGFDVVATYTNGQKAYEDLERTRPAVALLDIDLGLGWTGVETGLRLRQDDPQIGLVMLSNYALPDLLHTIPEHQVKGWSYLLKKSIYNIESLVRAIQGAKDGLVILDPALLEMAARQRKSPVHQLSKRQTDILALVSQGYTNSAIAKTLFLSEKSIENQLTGIYSALHINSGNPEEHARVKAVLTFLDQS